MRTGERNSLARKLALVLRHAPEKFDLEMDINGWIDIKDIIRQFKKRQQEVSLVETTPFHSNSGN